MNHTKENSFAVVACSGMNGIPAGKKSHEPSADQADPERRKFLQTGIFGLWGLIGSALSVPSLRYLFSLPKHGNTTRWVKAAALSELKVNCPAEVVFHRDRVDGWNVSAEKATAWVVKQAGDQAVAFAPQCTHLGCAYRWEESATRFICPCHSSIFSIEGKVLGGPAPRPLDQYAVRVEGGDLLLGPLATPEQAG